MSAPAEMQDAIELIWREADCLDAGRYDEWLGLWSEQGHYIIPIERSASSYADVLNVVYDDSAMRVARVSRLTSGASMSANSAARTVRTVSRFVRDETKGEVLALRCAQHLLEYKRGHSRLLAAEVVYGFVRRADGGLALSRKVVILANSEDALHGIGYLL